MSKHPPRTDRPAVTRHDARRRAVEILYEADQRRIRPTGLIEDRLGNLEGTPVDGFVRTLVEGVVANRMEIDEQLATYSHGWPPERMPAVDRAIARLGAYEILFGGDAPWQVVLDEAADLATELSTDKSPNFLSGLLGRLADIKQALA